MKKVFGIKVGSSLLTDGLGNIREEFILSLCTQVADIFRKGEAAFIVSSGAIASEPDTSMTKNLRAVIGQPELMSLYKRFFKIFGLKCGELLITDNDLKSDVLKKVLLEAFKRNVVLILNANDGTDDKESEALSECADNDQLMKNVALKLGNKVMAGVIIGFEEEGIWDQDGEIIRIVFSGEKDQVLQHARGGSSLGHGENGAFTKFSVAGELAEKGIPTILAPGGPNFINFSLSTIFQTKIGTLNFGTTFTTMRRVKKL